MHPVDQRQSSPDGYTRILIQETLLTLNPFNVFQETIQSRTFRISRPRFWKQDKKQSKGLDDNKPNARMQSEPTQYHTDYHYMVRSSCKILNEREQDMSTEYVFTQINSNTWTGTIEANWIRVYNVEKKKSIPFSKCNTLFFRLQFHLCRHSCMHWKLLQHHLFACNKRGRKLSNKYILVLLKWINRLGQLTLFVCQRSISYLIRSPFSHLSNLVLLGSSSSMPTKLWLW